MTLPSGWVKAKIGEVCVTTEQVVPPDDHQFIYVDIASVDRQKKQVTEPQVLIGKSAPSRARKLLRAGDCIVSTTRPNLNAVALIGQELDGQIASTGFEVLRSTGLDPRWMAYIVRTSAFVDAMSSLVQGALYPAVRGKDVQSFIAPIAPLAEQRRIADKLDTVLARVDAVNDRLTRVAPLLKRFRQSVLAAATSGRLTEEWRAGRSEVQWLETTVDAVASVGTGSTPLRSNPNFFSDDGVPWVTSAATGQAVVNSASEFVTDLAIAVHRLKRYPLGTLLVAMYPPASQYLSPR